MDMYSCVLLALSTVPSLGSSVAGFRALHKVHNNEGRLQDARGGGGAWWWGRKGGLGRGRGVLHYGSSRGGTVIDNDGGCARTRGASRHGGRKSGGKERGSLVAALGLMRYDV